MKNLNPLLIPILFFAISFGARSQFQYKVPDPVKIRKNQIDVIVCPKVELMSIVQMISEYPKVMGFLMLKDSCKYKDEVIEHFSPFKSHPVVELFNSLSLRPAMLNFSAPSNVMLITDNNLKPRKDIRQDDFVIKRIGGQDTLEMFLKLMTDFAVKSDFNRFFSEHQDFYKTIVQNAVNNLGNSNYIAELENFYGKKQKSYNIILVSLYSSCGYGNSLLCKGDKREIYNTMGTRKIINQIPDFGDNDYLKFMIRHEFSHPFINPLTEKYWDYIKEYSSNYDSIPEVARKNVCGDWQECINEFTIRAIGTFLAENESKELGKKIYDREKSRGVNNIDALVAKIQNFSANRKSYPDLESYYKNLLDVFKNQ